MDLDGANPIILNSSYWRNENYHDWRITCTLSGDFNSNCQVDQEDLVELTNQWNSSEGQPIYDPIVDLVPDRHIDIADLMRELSRLGQTCPLP
ncbi:MAG: hypothetical protein EXR62_17345 [Chloroflexi bacterium]|nr:hypothetical protein [Chloroflexota bacterium]